MLKWGDNENTNKSYMSQREWDRRLLLKKEKPKVYDKISKFEEKILKGESIAIIQLQYNYSCNFHCSHCGVTKISGERSLTPSDVKMIADQADEMGLANWVITGGEPLIFKDLDKVVEAIGPDRFFIAMDTNGWYLDREEARHLKDIGINKVQISIDSLNAIEHDDFRQKKYSWDMCMNAVKACKETGLYTMVQTVVTKDRVRSQELIDFIEHFNMLDIGVFITYAKPVGDWQGREDILIDRSDMDYIRDLEKTYHVFTHLTPEYGVDMGCIAMKRMFSITQYGDVMPCPYINVTFGNVFKEPLKDIVERGLKIPWFGQYKDTCLIAEDKDFIKKYEVGRLDGQKLPRDWKEVFYD